jgi:hypothetical protein
MESKILEPCPFHCLLKGCPDLSPVLPVPSFEDAPNTFGWIRFQGYKGCTSRCIHWHCTRLIILGVIEGDPGIESQVLVQFNALLG